MAHDATSVWRPAQVIENRAVADGSMWIVLEAADDFAAAFHPGHVLGLGLRLMDNSFMRHAYTVSRGEASSRRFEHLYRVISGGRMSPRLARLLPGDEVFFHGPFHTPIHQEIRSEAAGVILISTGAGIGPLFGYAAKTLAEGEARPVLLYAGFREESDACLGEELATLARRHPNFDWSYTFTRPSPFWRGLRGRVTESVLARIGRRELETHHFHLVGNGEMVHLVRSALHRAGVSPARVSIETYFNHHADPSDIDIERLALRLRDGGAFI